MDLPQDLLQQAWVLLTMDPTRPKQANLRRAASTAYYALFHALVERSAAMLVGASRPRRGLRRVLSRCYQHAEMRAACRSFIGGQMPKAVVESMGTVSVQTIVQDMARTFEASQDLRHDADYNLARGFGRDEVRALLERIETDLAAFDTLADDTVKDLFLLSLLTWRRVSGRG